MNWLDGLLLVILALTMFRGFRKGLIRSATELASLILAFFVSLGFYGEMAAWLRGFGFIQKMESYIADQIVGRIGMSGSEVSMSKIEEFGFSNEIMTFFEEGSFFKEMDVTSLGEFAANLVTNTISLLLLFILTVIVVRIAGAVLEGMIRLMGLAPLDHVLGLGFGTLKALLYLMAIALLLANAASFFEDGFVYDLYQGSFLAPLLYKTGFLQGIISLF